MLHAVTGRRSLPCFEPDEASRVPPGLPVRHDRRHQGRPGHRLHSPGEHAFGDAPFDLIATGGASGRPVTFDADGVCTVDGDTVTLTGAGDCTLRRRKPGLTTTRLRPQSFGPWTSRTSSVRSPIRSRLLSMGIAGTIVFGTPLGADQLDATVTTQGATGTITYVLADGVTPAKGAVLHAGDGQKITALFEPDEASRFLPTSRTVMIDVTKAQQVIDFRSRRACVRRPGRAAAGNGRPVRQAVVLTAAGSCEISSTTAVSSRWHVHAHRDASRQRQPRTGTPVTRSFVIAKAPLSVTTASVRRPYAPRTGAHPGRIPASSTATNRRPVTAGHLRQRRRSHQPGRHLPGHLRGSLLERLHRDDSPRLPEGRLRPPRFTWSMTAADFRRHAIRRNSPVTVRIGLTDAAENPIPQKLAKPIGKECRATLRVDGVAGTRSCFVTTEPGAPLHGSPPRRRSPPRQGVLGRARGQGLGRTVVRAAPSRSRSLDPNYSTREVARSARGLWT